MSEPSLAPSSIYPEIDWAISISLMKSIDERVATVTQTSSDETWVELSRPTSSPIFENGERIRIKHCDEESIYYWAGAVLKVVGRENQNMAISIEGEGVTLCRRKSLRLSSEIPLSFIVSQAKQKELVSEKALDLKIQNISVGGIAFETDLALEVGDELKVNVSLPRLAQVSAEGWVVRSEKVKHDGRWLNSIALEFLGLDPQKQKQIQQCMP
jgi:c-di-GMP-binding flagellar brake protein YcgR